jgi:hypothetical protein
MKIAKIYQPTKTAMQSGKAKTKFWLLEFEPQEKKQVDNLMGWQGSGDTRQQLKLKFETKEEAIEYATKQKIAFEVIEPQKRAIRLQTYADNFMK